MIMIAWLRDAVLRKYECSLIPNEKEFLSEQRNKNNEKKEQKLRTKIHEKKKQPRRTAKKESIVKQENILEEWIGRDVSNPRDTRSQGEDLVRPSDG